MREVTVLIKDDLDRTLIADQTHYVGFDGQWYEMDLTSDHAEELALAVARFLGAGRKVSADEVVKPRKLKPAHVQAVVESKALNKQVREWAKAQVPPLPVSSSNGYKIPPATLQAYEAANPERMVS